MNNLPEGPEVESVRKLLLPFINKQIKAIKLTELSQKYPKYQGKQKLFEEFNNAVLTNIERHGKFLIWKFSVKSVILNHLGMSGRWVTQDNELTTHPKAEIFFEDTTKAIFDDQRNFGQFSIFDSYEDVLNYKSIKSLGIDGLTEEFDLDFFLELLNKSRYVDKSVGAALMDQRLVAGVGNIYKSESLFAANIHPETIISKLTINEKKNLGLSINKVLRKALDDNGSTFGVNQRYSLPDGNEGQAQNWHNVYGKNGKACRICGDIIIRIKQKDRSSFFCPTCQKLKK